jgi:DNA invertase Pin-like site-specific DNA recombinase
VTRAALYLRVSTDAQTVENQRRELRQIAERRGWEIVEEFSDAGISGARGRDKRPGLDQMLKDASKRMSSHRSASLGGEPINNPAVPVWHCDGVGD